MGAVARPLASPNPDDSRRLPPSFDKRRRKQDEDQDHHERDERDAPQRCRRDRPERRTHVPSPRVQEVG